MRHAVAQAAAHTRPQAPGSAYSQAEHDAAYGLGQFGARHWPAARKAMPEGSALRDWRDQCAKGFLAGMKPEGHGLLPSMLAGFDDEAEDRYWLNGLAAESRRITAAADTVLCLDVEDAEEWPTLGKAYTVRSVVGDVLVITDDSGDPEGRHYTSHFVTA